MTTHVFIVDKNTFPVHLEFLFAGTGASDKEEHASLCADISRLRPGDPVVFYLLGVGFFGVFRVADRPDYIFQDNGDYLFDQLRKKLIYRAFVEPARVYQLGVSEWQALDLLPLYAREVIWSLIYRKLRANRGCTPITLEESDRLVGMLKEWNNGNTIVLAEGETVKYNASTLSLEGPATPSVYKGPRVWKPDYELKVTRAILSSPIRACESWLEGYITGNYGRNDEVRAITGTNLIWLGNQVRCGVGMQTIDVLSICEDARQNRVHRVIELKDEPAEPDVCRQLSRYVEWCSCYLKDAINANIVPVVVGASPRVKWKTNASIVQHGQRMASAFDELDAKCIAQPVQYFEFDIADGRLSFSHKRGSGNAPLLSLQ